MQRNIQQNRMIIVVKIVIVFNIKYVDDLFSLSRLVELLVEYRIGEIVMDTNRKEGWKELVDWEYIEECDVGCFVSMESDGLLGKFVGLFDGCDIILGWRDGIWVWFVVILACKRISISINEYIKWNQNYLKSYVLGIDYIILTWIRATTCYVIIRYSHAVLTLIIS